MHPRHRAMIDTCYGIIAWRVDMNLLWCKFTDYGIFTQNNPIVKHWLPSLNELATKKNIILTTKVIRQEHVYYKIIMSLRDCGYNSEADYLEGLITLESYIAQSPETLTLSRMINGNFNEQQQKDYDKRAGPEAETKLIVQVEKSKQFRDVRLCSQDFPRYRMRSSPRGLVLIITVIHYEKCGTRYGAEVDDENLAQLFEQMDFTICRCRTDFTAQEIKQKVQNFSKTASLKDVDSCFVIISGHGDQCSVNGGIILGSDYYIRKKKERKNAVVSVTELLQFFTSENCPQLKGKPKVFILQTCRGQLEQRPRAIGCNGKISNEGPCYGRPTGHVAEQESREYDDMLVAHATLRGHKCYRNKVYGSWFIQILCEVFMKHAWYSPIHDLFSKIDELLKERYQGISQTPSYEYIGFNKHLYINPGLTEESSEDRPSSVIHEG